MVAGEPEERSVSRLSAPVAVALAALFLLLPSGAFAADVTGTWRIDREALARRFEARFEEEMKAELAQLPAEAAEAVRADVRRRIGEMVARMEGTVELRGDGSAVLSDPSGPREEGRWREADGGIEIRTGDGRVWLARPEGGRRHMRPRDRADVPFTMVLMRAA